MDSPAADSASAAMRWISDSSSIAEGLPLTPQRQPTPLVGRRGLFWEFDGRKPEGKVLWNVWISFRDRPPKFFNIYYTVEEEYKFEDDIVQEDNDEGGDGDGDGDGDDEGDEGDEDDEGDEYDDGEVVDQDIDYEIAAKDLKKSGSLNFFCCPIKEIFHFVLYDLLKFICSIPPPATVVFVSGNAAFAPFLCKVKKKGYHVLVISNSECASSAFQDAGLTLYDWNPLINGEGFFPLEECGLNHSKKRDYASFSKE